VTRALILSLPAQPGVGSRAEKAADAARQAQLSEFVCAHVDFVWRSLARLGVRAPDLDDAVQEVFVVATRRWESARDNPRRFLFRTAMNVAAHARRTRARHRETGEEPSEEQIDPNLLADEQLDLARARELLNCALDRIPIERRTVFVLYELEELTMAEIAELLELRPGTVASRLRQARQDFFTAVQRLESNRRRRA
jgi:RNA polymerase sigma-70 factor (ECF subfamily)